MATDFRISVKESTKKRFNRAAKKEGEKKMKFGDKVVIAGLRDLGY